MGDVAESDEAPTRGVADLRSVIDACIRYRLLVIAAAAVVMVLGIMQLSRMPTDVLPETSPVTVDVSGSTSVGMRDNCMIPRTMTTAAAASTSSRYRMQASMTERKSATPRVGASSLSATSPTVMQMLLRVMDTLWVRS